MQHVYMRIVVILIFSVVAICLLSFKLRLGQLYLNHLSVRDCLYKYFVYFYKCIYTCLLEKDREKGNSSKYIILIYII